jgi:NHS family xanthosine MFS transporter
VGIAFWVVCLWKSKWFMDDHYVLCVVYGMAFDFFNISGSLFLKTNTEPKIVVSTRVIHDDDKWFWSSFRKFYFRWAIDKYFTKSFSSANDLLVF